MQKKLLNISAMLASACHQNRTRSKHDICGAVLQALANYSRYENVMRHMRFEQYVSKHVKELTSMLLQNVTRTSRLMDTSLSPSSLADRCQPLQPLLKHVELGLQQLFF